MTGPYPEETLAGTERVFYRAAMATDAVKPTEGAEEADPVIEALLGGARDLTERLSSIPDGHPAYHFAVDLMGSLAVDLRACGELL